jgi:hypothetical protein
MIRGDWSIWDNFSFKFFEREGWLKGFRASEIDEEER